MICRDFELKDEIQRRELFSIYFSHIVGQNYAYINWNSVIYVDSNYGIKTK